MDQWKFGNRSTWNILVGLFSISFCLDAFSAPEIYFDAGNGVTSQGGAVSSWANSGTDNLVSAEQTASDAQPVLILDGINGQPVVQFDGGNDQLLVPNRTSINTGGPYIAKSISIVFRTGVDITNRQVIWEQGGGTRGISVYLDQGQLYFGVWSNSAWTAFIPVSVGPEQTYIATFVIDSATGTAEAFIGGGSVGSVAGVTSLNNHNGNVAFGGIAGATYFHDAVKTGSYLFTGQIAEFRSYNTALSITEREALETSLLEKYFELNAPTNFTATSVSSTEVSLAWEDQSDNESGFFVDYREGTADWETIVVASADETTVLIDGFSESSSYEFRVVAFNSTEISSYSETVGVTTYQAPEIFFDAAQGIVSAGGGSVSVWSNSGSDVGALAQQTTAARQPIWAADGINGLPIIQFDGIDDQLLVPDRATINTGGPYAGKTINVVIKTGDDVTSRQTIWEQGGVTRGMGIYLDQGQLYLSAWNLNETSWTAYLPTVASAQQTYVATLVIDSISGSAEAFVNGISIGSLSGVAELYNHTDDNAFGRVVSTTYFHDGVTSGDFPFSGLLSEFRSYDSALGQGERESLETTLVAKYFPGSGPVPNPPTGLTTTVLSASEVDLNWQDQSIDETGFQIEYREGTATDWSILPLTFEDETGFTVGGLVAGTSYEFRVAARNENGLSTYSNVATVTTEASGPTGPNAVQFTLEAMSSDEWVEVVLPTSYDSMVVVASPQYEASDLPAVVRIRNATGDRFEVRVQNPSDALLTDYTVHFLVLEEGVYNEAEHGVKLEALKVTSTTTQLSSAWATVADVGYINTYSAPVVLGQVMSANDPLWSVFWADGGNQTSPPSASTLRVGKHVGEDFINSGRFDEILGYVVFESGEGVLGEASYVAGLGADTVRGVGTAPPYNYALSGDLLQPEVAILSAAGMDGNDGIWPILFGTAPLSATAIQLAVDEDQLSDAERAHTTEQVAYVVFESSVVIAVDSDGDGLDDEWELSYFGSLNEDETGDFDGDGLTNLQEFQLGTLPNSLDSDGDGLFDGYEVVVGSDPLAASVVEDELVTELKVYTPTR